MNIRIVHVKYELYRRKEVLIRAFVWKLPRRVVYWAAIRLMSAATLGAYSSQIVPELTALDALKRWDEE